MEILTTNPNYPKSLQVWCFLPYLLFNLFINDLNEKLENDCILAFFADDISILLSHKNFQTLVNKCNSKLEILYEWCKINSLYLNHSKTSFTRFRNSHLSDVNLELCINEEPITNSTKTKFLGIWLEELGSWKTHCDELSSKLNSVIFQVRHLKSVLNFNQILLFYHAVVESRLRYGIRLWGSSAHANRVFMVQKRIIRCIANIKQQHSCREIFLKYRIMTLIELYILDVSYIKIRTNSLSTQSLAV